MSEDKDTCPSSAPSGSSRGSSDELRDCLDSDRLASTGYIVYASLSDEANDGWCWLSLPHYPSRTPIEIRSANRKVFCEYRKIDENFRRQYNDAGHTKRIDSIDKKCRALILNAWYREALGIKTSWQLARDAGRCDESSFPIELGISRLKLPGWRSLRVTSYHPDIVVRLATRLGILGARLGIFGIAVGLDPLFSESFRWTHTKFWALSGAVLLLLAVVGAFACRGPKRAS